MTALVNKKSLNTWQIMNSSDVLKLYSLICL